MKLKLPLTLLSALALCINMAAAQETTEGDTTTTLPKLVNDEKGYSSSKHHNDNPKGTMYCYLTQEAEYTQNHDYYDNGYATVLNVGALGSDGSLSVTGDGTVVNVGGHLYVGGKGNNQPASTTAGSGYVFVGKGATLNTGAHPGIYGTDLAQLNISAPSGKTAKVVVEGTLTTSGAINMALNSGDTNAEVIVQNGGKLALHVKDNVTHGTPGQVVLGWVNGSNSSIVVDEKSTFEITTTETRQCAALVYLGYLGDAALDVKDGSTVSLTTGYGRNINYVGVSGGVEGIINVDGNSTLTMGDAYIGYSGTGTLTASNNSVVNVAEALTIRGQESAVSIGSGSDLKVTGNATVKSGSSLTVTDGTGETGASSVTITGTHANSGTTTVTLNNGGSFSASAVTNAGEMNVTLANGGSFNTASLENHGNLNVDITDGGNFTATEYVNYGNSTITAADGTTCSFGSLNLLEGSMTLDGKGSFELGNETAGVATTFNVSGTHTTTNINIASLGNGVEGGVDFTINLQSNFTLNFADDALAGIAANSAQDFKLTLIYGYEGFSMTQNDLNTLLNNTGYNIQKAATEAMLMTLAATEEAPAINHSDFVVTDAQYIMEGNNLVWTGTVQNNAVPEPTTATLSLLALAGLAARRRRK